MSERTLTDGSSASSVFVHESALVVSGG